RSPQIPLLPETLSQILTMPIYAAKEAKEFWKEGHARSLAASRFSSFKKGPNGTEDESYRKTATDQIVKGAVHKELAGSHRDFINTVRNLGGVDFFATLEARLILNS